MEYHMKNGSEVGSRKEIDYLDEQIKEYHLMHQSSLFLLNKYSCFHIVILS